MIFLRFINLTLLIPFIILNGLAIVGFLYSGEVTFLSYTSIISIILGTIGYIIKFDNKYRVIIFTASLFMYLPVMVHILPPLIKAEELVPNLTILDEQIVLSLIIGVSLTFISLLVNLLVSIYQANK